MLNHLVQSAAWTLDLIKSPEAMLVHKNHYSWASYTTKSEPGIISCGKSKADGGRSMYLHIRHVEVRGQLV